VTESGAAESLFAQWLARRDAGETEPIERWAEAHPEHCAAILEIHAAWRRRVARAAGATENGASLADRLRDRFGPDVDPGITLDGETRSPASPSRSGSGSRLLDDLSARQGASGRYRVDRRIAQGGMGAILEVYDRDLRRHLAMKMMLEDKPALLARFLEEAQVTGQLDHPGIVPVHELGIDARGQVFFTMKLVKGKDLREIFSMARAGIDGWNLTRAVDVLKRVCEAMAFAHEKNVIHRDLKPGNVMVGRHGEVFVMDWGLAKVLGRTDSKDVRIAPTSSTLVSTERRESAGDTPESALLTMDGDAIGTPSYMPIEQAEGNLEAIGPRSDVYAIGAMLYHLLAGRAPYLDPDEFADGRTILSRVIGGPPEPLRVIAKDAPAELVAICEKAMAREARDRYRTMAALGEDLRAYLERRVVKAHRTGMFAETRMWLRRNPILATAFALLVASLCGIVWQQRIVVLRERSVAHQQRTIAESERARAAERDRVMQLADVKELRDLQRRGEALLADRAAIYSGESAYAGTIASLERWIADAETLAARLPDHEATLRDLETRGRYDRLAGAWAFDSREDSWWHSALTELVSGFRSLSSTEPERASIPTMLGRLEELESIFRNSIGDHRDDWERCIASIADATRCPLYRGLRIVPQVGLLPIGRDPQSGLWEFWFVEVTGTKPVRGADGKLSLTDDVGLVFVLIPGGTFWMGAQNTDPQGRNYDPQATENELPVHEITLAPYFLSKYELTQHQWLLALRAKDWSLANERSRIPVANVSWDDVDAYLRALLLDFPTEAQWEFAARAGTTTPWYCGVDARRVFDFENLSEHALADFPPPAAIGSFPANPFGMHDMLGNLGELCRDGRIRVDDYTLPVKPGTGERIIDQPPLRAVRGGSCWIGPEYARVSIRSATDPPVRFVGTGVRPARSIRQ
jgi:serine/threonine protein kinase/formylglycine-generating enzyme required for sulfatase activity